jgi:predicted  nucleic acid-binding Zn-ribbon protein
MASDASARPEIRHSGDQITDAHPGGYYCVDCGYALSANTPEELPECPACGGDRFRRGSMFDRPPAATASSFAITEDVDDRLEEIKAELDQAGTYLAFDEGDGEYAVIRLDRGWTRVGRSRTADLRLDDATVSRRHALLVLSPGGELRALDDRSMNGLFVNGQCVDWAVLHDGDELEVGRYRLHVVEA